MSEDRLQRGLNDYLDDRMDADERERFEERLATDEELGRRLATAREIRAALLSGEEELSPGFYTRTVARFAATRRRAPFGLTWSTVGLAAATIAAAAIFVPVILREEIPEMPVASRTQDEATRLPADPSTDDGNRFGEEVESSLQSLGRVADDRALADQDKGDVLVEKSIAAPEPKFRDAPVAGPAQEDRKRQTANEALAPLLQKRSESAAKPKISETLPPAVAQQPERLIAIVPEPEPPVVVDEEEQNLGRGLLSGKDSLDGLEGKATSEVVEGVDASERADNAREFDVRTEAAGTLVRVGVELSDFYNLEHSSIPAPVELKADLVGAGEIELLNAQDVQQRLGAGRKKENKSAAPVNRFVAIGRRPGLDACSALNVRRTDEAWEISYEDSGSRLGSVSCGIDLPDDGAEIRFQGWRVGE